MPGSRRMRPDAALAAAVIMAAAAMAFQSYCRPEGIIEDVYVAARQQALYRATRGRYASPEPLSRRSSAQPRFGAFDYCRRDFDAFQAIFYFICRRRYRSCDLITLLPRVSRHRVLGSQSREITPPISGALARRFRFYFQYRCRADDSRGRFHRAAIFPSFRDSRRWRDACSQFPRASSQDMPPPTTLHGANAFFPHRRA